MKPVKHKEHLESLHPQHSLDSLEVFQSSFVNKISLWERFQLENLANFPTLELKLSKSNIVLSCSIQTQMCEHLDVLKTLFGDYLDSNNLKAEIWIRNHFLVDLNTIDDSDMIKNKIIDLR